MRAHALCGTCTSLGVSGEGASAVQASSPSIGSPNIGSNSADGCGSEVFNATGFGSAASFGWAAGFGLEDDDETDPEVQEIRKYYKEKLDCIGPIRRPGA